MTIAATSPLEAARRARYLRSFANRPDATPSQRRERWAEAETWQSMAVCGVHALGDRSEEQ